MFIEEIPKPLKIFVYFLLGSFITLGSFFVFYISLIIINEIISIFN